MLSNSILKTFSRFIYINTKLYLIPSIWDPLKRQFDEVTSSHRRIEEVVSLFEIAFRTWCNFAYGYMIYTSLQDPSTVIRALLPIMYLCALNWCAIIRFISHAFRVEIEQFLNNFVEVNAYLGKL